MAVKETLRALPGPPPAPGPEGGRALARHGLGAIARSRGVVTHEVAGGAAQVRFRVAAAIAALQAGGGALEGAKVEYIALKGPLLGLRLWGDPGLRPTNDADLLVREADRDRALAALAAIGYAPSARTDVAWHLAHHHHLELVSERGAAIELHWKANASNGVAIPTGALFERSTPFEALGVRARILAREDEWTYLAIHAAVHVFTPLSLLLDLKMLALQGLDRELAWKRAVEWRARTAVGVAARMVERFTGLALPELEGGPRAAVVAAAIPDAALVSGIFVEKKRLTYLPGFAMTDSAAVIARDFMVGTRRGLGRRLRGFRP